MAEFSEKYKQLGQILVQKLRDETYEIYLEKKAKAKSMTVEEYYQLSRNPHYSPDLQKLDDERFEFLNGLNQEQLGVLDRLILYNLDLTAFIFLKEVEENLFKDKSIGLTINGSKVEEISREFLGGYLFSEYLLWLEKYSKYGKKQF